MRANGMRIKRIHMKCQAHTRASRCGRRQEVPQVRPEISRVGATKQRSLATEQTMLNAAPTTLRQSITPSRSRRRHGDGDLVVRPRTQTMQGNGIPVHRVAAREPSRKDTEERERHSRARVQERPWRRAHGEGAPERVDVCGGPRATPAPRAKTMPGPPSRDSALLHT
jgi:hypothetical protein